MMIYADRDDYGRETLNLSNREALAFRVPRAGKQAWVVVTNRKQPGGGTTVASGVTKTEARRLLQAEAARF